MLVFLAKLWAEWKHAYFSRESSSIEVAKSFNLSPCIVLHGRKVNFFWLLPFQENAASSIFWLFSALLNLKCKYVSLIGTVSSLNPTASTLRQNRFQNQFVSKSTEKSCKCSSVTMNLRRYIVNKPTWVKYNQKITLTLNATL